jgi:flagellar hook-basal body complex protein FliE
MSIIDRTYGVAGLPQLPGIAKADKASETNGTDLGQSFSKALDDAKALDTDATQQAERFANHDPSVGIHEVVIASEKASIAVRYAVTLKNKALEAYHELMNTQV